MAGVRIVTRDGGTPSVGALLVRNVFRLIDSLPLFYLTGIVVSLVSREHLRIGDMAAGTLLVHDGGEAVAALDVLANVARDTPHDPALIDLAQDVLRRWDELEADAAPSSHDCCCRSSAPPAKARPTPRNRRLRARLQAALNDAGHA